MLQLTKLTPASITNYFRYSGSLTTPDCDEIVEWFVINEPLYISDEQLLEFQSIEDKSGYPVSVSQLKNLYLSQINNRFVLFCFFKDINQLKTGTRDKRASCETFVWIVQSKIGQKSRDTRQQCMEFGLFPNETTLVSVLNTRFTNLVLFLLKNIRTDPLCLVFHPSKFFIYFFISQMEYYRKCLILSKRLLKKNFFNTKINRPWMKIHLYI